MLEEQFGNQIEEGGVDVGVVDVDVVAGLIHIIALWTKLMRMTFRKLILDRGTKLKRMIFRRLI